MATQEVSALIAKLEAMARDAPSVGTARKKLYDAAQSLTTALESSADTIQRIAYSGAPITVVRIGADLNLFEILAETKAASLSVGELAEITGADYLLISRLLRSLASHEIIKEVGENQYAASHITHTLANPRNMAGIMHNFDTIMPAWLALPAFLAASSYQTPTEPTACAFQLAHHTQLPASEWLPHNPSHFSNFNLWKATRPGGQAQWLDVFPFQQHLCQDLTPSEPLFVEISGGIGQQCAALKSRFRTLPGRVILQDTAAVLAQAPATQGVEPMAYDIWTPQPVVGARAYYLRNVLHDHADARCVSILRNTMSAMGPDSVILIDEMVLPNEGAAWGATQLDVLALAWRAGMERSERQWAELLEMAGLRVLGIWRYAEDTGESVIMVKPSGGVMPGQGMGGCALEF